MLPLMDTMFLLLVFFIYAMMNMVVHQGIPIKLPEASTSVSDQKEFVEITVKADGTYWVEKSVMHVDELPAYISHLKSEKKEPHLYIRADHDAIHGKVIFLLDLIRKAEIKKVSFETRNE